MGANPAYHPEYSFWTLSRDSAEASEYRGFFNWSRPSYRGKQASSHDQVEPAHVNVDTMVSTPTIPRPLLGVFYLDSAQAGGVINSG